MSVAYYIVLEKPCDEVDTFVNGKAVAHVADGVLAGICSSLSVQNIEDFISVGADDFEYGDFDFEVEETGTALVEQWFDAEDGISCFGALVGYLEAHADVMPSQQDVISDLNEYLSLLAELKSRHIRWQLAVDC